MLLTNRARSFGSILVNMSHGPRRARFSIAHELGHFLLERHVLSQDDGFRCTSQDMREARDDTRHHKQEAEANHFAAALLAPAYKMRPVSRPIPTCAVSRAPLTHLISVSRRRSGATSIS